MRQSLNSSQGAVTTERNAEPCVVYCAWQAISELKPPKHDAVLDFLLVKFKIKKADGEIQLKAALKDGLLFQVADPKSKEKVYTLPSLSVKQPLRDAVHDAYCFHCHLGGVVFKCASCWRAYHTSCRPVTKSNCEQCASIPGKPAVTPSSRLSKLLSFVLALFRDWLILHQFEEKKLQDGNTQWLFYRRLDIPAVEKRLAENYYTHELEFQRDLLVLLHNLAILYGDNFEESLEKVESLVERDMSELSLCSQCYLMSNLTPQIQKGWTTGSDWFSVPCVPPHCVVYAKQRGFPFWPAKILREEGTLLDVRFFGGEHERAKVPLSSVKPIETDLKKLGVKRNNLFRRSEVELELYQRWSHKQPAELVEYMNSLWSLKSCKGLPPQIKLDIATAADSEAPESGSDVEDGAAGEEPTAKKSKGTFTRIANSLRAKVKTKVKPESGDTLQRRLSAKITGAAAPQRSIASTSKEKTRRIDSGVALSEQKSPEKRKRARSPSVEKKVELTTSSPSPKKAKTPVKKTRSGSAEKPPPEPRASRSSTADNSSNSKPAKPLVPPKTHLSSSNENDAVPVAAKPKTKEEARAKHKFKAEAKTRRLSEAADQVGSASESTCSSTSVDAVSSSSTATAFVTSKPEAASTVLTKVESHEPTALDLLSSAACMHAEEEMELTTTAVPSDVAFSSAEVSCALKLLASTSAATLPSVASSSTSVVSEKVETSERLPADERSLHDLMARLQDEEQLPPPRQQAIVKPVQNPTPVEPAPHISCNCAQLYETRLHDTQEATRRAANELRVREEEFSSRLTELQSRLQATENMHSAKSQELEQLKRLHVAEINQTKRKQWCSQCLNDAMYHCCWNTAYCSIRCQQMHWVEHKRVCRRKNKT